VAKTENIKKLIFKHQQHKAVEIKNYCNECDDITEEASVITEEFKDISHPNHQDVSSGSGSFLN
jgi:hypothetical protein